MYLKQQVALREADSVKGGHLGGDLRGGHLGGGHLGGGG